MITLFTVPKAFRGLDGIIQRNALRSWSLLKPKCDIILIGNDSGTKEATEEFGVRHIQDVECNEYGTPLVNSIYQSAASAANHDILCHVNADIILMDDFMLAVETVVNNYDKFLLTGQRWNVDIEDSLDFSDGWQDGLRSLVATKGSLGARTGMDYLVFPKRFTEGIPPFAIGRTAYDQWLIFRTRLRGEMVVDATSSVLDVHQNHSYSHHTPLAASTSADLERRKNIQLAGGEGNLFIIKDRTVVLRHSALKKPLDFWTIWRFMRTISVLRPQTPFPIKFILRVINFSIDFSSGILATLRLLERGVGPWARKNW